MKDGRLAGRQWVDRAMATLAVVDPVTMLYLCETKIPVFT